MSERAVKISVIVPVYNRADQLRCLLDSFEKLAPSPTFEIIIVDDCSTDSAVETLARAWSDSVSFPVRYIRCERNGGPSAARNRGLTEARADIIAFTDSDCRVDSQWLHYLIQKLDPEKGIVGVGGRVRPVNGDGIISGYNTVNHILEPYGDNYLITANCCYLADSIRTAGGFDEEIRHPGGDDISLSIRVGLNGGKFAFTTDAIVYHDYRESLTGFIKTFMNYGFGNGFIISKYFGADWYDQTDDPVWDPRLFQPPGVKYRHVRYHLPTQYWTSRRAGKSRWQSLIFVWMRLLQMFIHIWYFAKGEETVIGQRSLRARLRILWNGYPQPNPWKPKPQTQTTLGASKCP